MKADSKSYDIIIEPAVAGMLSLLKNSQHADILERLCRAAEAAAAPRRVRVGVEHVEGVHRGLHSALVGPHSIVYRVDHAVHTVSLVKVRDRRPHPATTDLNRWDNEGGNQPQR
ncbi:MAG: hypothetical protein JNK82_03790 [Myxococcaceae bacterium]|nr:hypothetical protein [Myxococcaceae bacterium]